MRALVIMTTLLFATSAFAQSPKILKRKADRVNTLVIQNAEDLTLDEQEEVMYSLDRIIEIIAGELAEDTSVPPRAYAIHTAECDIDNDINFDWGQRSGGEVSANDIPRLLEECKEIAIGYYGDRSSYGIKNVHVIDVPADFQTAVCHLDDDKSFDYGQVVVGNIAGADVKELISACVEIATSILGERSSAGLQSLNSKRTAPDGVRTAICHIDDDKRFDPDQMVVGTVWGNATSSLTESCSSIARMVYSDLSSSGLRDIQ